MVATLVRVIKFSKTFISLFYKRGVHSNNAIPSPKELPLLGHLHLFSPLGPYRLEKIIDALFDLRRKFGPIVRLKLGVEMVVVFDPKDAEKVFRNEGRYPVRPAFEALLHYRRSQPQHYNRMGLFTDHGDNWWSMRQLCNVLLRPDVAESYLHQQSQVADDFMACVKLHWSDGGVISNVLTHLYKYTQEAFGVVCFGSRLGCLSLSPGHPCTPAAADTVNAAVCLSLDALAQTMFGVPWWKLNLHTNAYTALCTAQHTLRNVTEAYLDRCLALDPSERGVFLHSLLSRDDVDRRDVILTLLELFHAAIDATASTIALCLYHIARHPDVQSRVVAEVDEVAGGSGGGGQLTVDRLREMRYLKACLRETMRLTPAAGGTARVLNQTLILSNYTVKAGTLVLCCHPVMSRDETLVADPDTFCPDRWLKPSAAEAIGQPAATPPPFVTLPFSFGTRMCPGKRVAQQEMLIFLIKFFINFRCFYEGPEVGCVMRLNLMPDRSINLTLIRR